MNYFAEAGLSFSAMKDLAISPMRYWYQHRSGLAPERKETPEMRFGSAVHCAVLEPDQFDARYARAFEPTGDGWLFTASDIKERLAELGLKTSGLKDELIERLLQVAPDSLIVDVEAKHHAIGNADKIILPPNDYDRCVNCAGLLRSEPAVAAILAEGWPEVAMFARDPETEVMLKGKADWVSPHCTLDVKTFQLKRTTTIDQAVMDAFWYEGYYKQAYTYMHLRSLLPNEKASHKQVFVFAFVESEPPHEVRLIEIRPSQCPVLWERAKYEVHTLIRTYAMYAAKFGNNPWREPAEICGLIDDEVRQLAFS